MRPQSGRAAQVHEDGYKWVALSNTTLGILMATINSSIVLISLPGIFRGIQLDPLVPSNVSYLLWMLMGYMLVTAVLVVSLGRIGDMFGRVRMFRLGFTIFTVASVGLSLVFWHGPAAALTLIGFRVVQGIGGAMLMANSAAIVTDAFPGNQRGMALGVNSVAGIAGSFIGLVVGGLLSTTDWHLVFLVSVPVGAFGTVWAVLRLREIGVVRRSRIDWWGNLTFGVGLISLLVGITYGIQPYGGHSMGWTNPMVLSALAAGIVLLFAFAIVETRVSEPMFRLSLFRVPAFTAGNVAALLGSIGRGGLMFMLIIWLQGIWLPLHGYSYEQTPFWSAVYMLPMTAGFLIAGPISGFLSDHFGARPFATGGMLAAAGAFGLMLLLPANFAYLPFGALLLGLGLSMGLFAAPNTAGIMNSVPAANRGVASGMLATFQNAGMNLSIGLFFSLMVSGLSASLPSTLYSGLTAQGVPAAVATRVANLPPVGSLFAAFLGYNPIQSLLGPALTALPPARAAYLTGRTFFPNLISQPFMSGMHITFAFALVMMLVAAAASWMRGGKYMHGQEPQVAAVASVPRFGDNGHGRQPSHVGVHRYEAGEAKEARSSAMLLRFTVGLAWSLLVAMAGGWIVLSAWVLQPPGTGWTLVTRAEVGAGAGLLVLALLGVITVMRAVVGDLREAGVVPMPVPRPRRQPELEPSRPEPKAALPAAAPQLARDGTDDLDAAIAVLARALAAEVSKQDAEGSREGRGRPQTSP